MLVPRSFQHAPSPSRDLFDEKSGLRRAQKSMSPKGEKRTGFRPASPARTTTEPVRVPTPPIAVRAPARTHSAAPAATATLRGVAPNGSGKKSPAHDPKALPPAVAALLAVTRIPRPKHSQLQWRPDNSRRISIEDLVSEWKNDEGLSASYSSSPGLSILLEDTDGAEGKCSPEQNSVAEDGFSSDRSISAESLPSLDGDNQSILSNGSLSTPESVRSRKSTSNLKKEKPRSVPTIEECAFDHPLITAQPDDEGPDEEFILSPPNTTKASRPKPKSRFTSNLTISLQTLKNAALSSISSFNFGSSTSTSSVPPSSTSPFPVDVLWSHPFLFPRFSPEIRPAIEGIPTEAQRRYLNPTPLTFEEQEAPYQLALHAPYLAEPIEGAPTIQMQTYSRGRRKSGSKRAGPDPRSEAGRVLLGAAGVRNREPRENSDFLRVVVLEMNMRREGKLEMGRAKIWLPPRQVRSTSEPAGKVPRRWVGESAY